MAGADGFCIGKSGCYRISDECTRFAAESMRYCIGVSARCFDSGGPCTYHARAMGNPLRERRTVSEWASVGQVIEFAEEVGFFDDLSRIIENDLAVLDADKIPEDWRNSPVSGVIRFGYLDGESSLPIVVGQVFAEIDAVCQRCLEPFRLRVASEPRLVLPDGDRNVSGTDGYEVWELDDRMLRPMDIVEELLTLAMPFAAMHEDRAECRAVSLDEEPAEEKTRPFASLREQMRNKE